MTILDEIIVNKRKELALAIERTSLRDLEKRKLFRRRILSMTDFIVDPARTGIIAEFKRKSPSRGVINDEVTIEEVTTGYFRSGASALSVLTDQMFFGGSESDLTRARELNSIPILRKDFILDEYQIIEARSMGADAILLIAAVLSASQVLHLARFARSLEMEVLLEIHGRQELDRLCEFVDMVGVNNRDLNTFEVDIEVSLELAADIPSGFLRISESGITSPLSVKRLKSAGFHGFLIGENFMRARTRYWLSQILLNLLCLSMSRVKVCGLTEARNAREVAEAGADFAGFIFYRRSKRFVGETPDEDLFISIPERVKKVGVFVNEKKEKILELARKYQLDLVQLHGDETPAFCNYLKINDLVVMKAFGIGEDFDFNGLSAYHDTCDFFLFDTLTMLYGGSGIKFRWEQLEDYTLDTPFFLGGGIGPLDAQKVLSIRHPYFFAADINSRFETSPGMKDINIVKTFIQHLKPV